VKPKFNQDSSAKLMHQ